MKKMIRDGLDIMKIGQFTKKHGILTVHAPDSEAMAHLKQTPTEFKRRHKFTTSFSTSAKILLPFS